MLEVEIKFPVERTTAVEAKLASFHAVRREQREEIDHYFNAPDRDFAVTDEAFRLRQIGQQNFLTYKGPKRDKETKTRTEIEVPLQSGEDAALQMIKLVKNLGYKLVATLRKSRTIHEMEYQGSHLEICLDHVVGLGDFIELEIIAPEDREKAAKQSIQDIARQLGLEQSERRSYLELHLASGGCKPADR